MSQAPELTPYFVHEIMENIEEELHVGERQFRNNNEDSYLPVTYMNQRLHIQTPKMMVVYGLTPYIRKSDKEKKYCLHLSLRPSTNDIKEFATFMKHMDKWAETYRTSLAHNYWSSIKDEAHSDPDTKSPTLLLKINTTHRKLLLDIYDIKGQLIALPTAEDFDKAVPAKTLVQAIIEVNPIWFAGKKFGISYRLVKLKVCELPKKSIAFR